MDFEFIREQTPLYIEAAKLTLHMAVIGVILAIIVGLVCSMIKYFRIPVLRQIVECYIELSRNTPLLIRYSSCTSVFQKSESYSAPNNVQFRVWHSWVAATWQRLSEVVWTMFHRFR